MNELLERNSQRSEVFLSQDLKTNITETTRFDKETRMEVYGYAYWARLVDNLRDDFEKVSHFFTREAFTDLLRDYLATYPSQHYSLPELGRRFPQFLREENVSPMLCELATLEWHIFEIEYFTEQPRPSIADIESGNLKLKDSIQVLDFTYPVVQIFNKAKDFPPEAQSVVVVKNERASSYVVEPAAAIILRSLLAGESIDDALVAAGELSPEKVQEYFQEFMANGFFTSESLATP